ncbi:Uncharacterised protein [Mycobacteroides abscessus]|uniref:hypothetical protein n=1 Tax=Mycobacteroides abscessus TaxID=36809 RepID=UPI0005E612E7|nr:hypothetical protein [Mycobacteroides abscessus]CPX20685.1 Uncharacterised protein [Mycobacteroides abscessus]CRG61244.1 Uncharacterised protein [Mycobacteroides abscessus]
MTDTLTADKFEFLLRFQRDSSGQIGELTKTFRAKVLKTYPTSTFDRAQRKVIGDAAADAAFEILTTAFERFITEVTADEEVRETHSFERDMPGDDEVLNCGNGLSVRRGDQRFMRYELELQELFPQWLKAHPEVREEALNRAIQAAATS